MSRAALILCC